MVFVVVTVKLPANFTVTQQIAFLQPELLMVSWSPITRFDKLLLCAQGSCTSVHQKVMTKVGHVLWCGMEQRELLLWFFPFMNLVALWSYLHHPAP